jgi:hypothetical protein
MGTALQIQALLDRTGQRPDVHTETTDNCQRNDQEFP